MKPELGLKQKLPTNKQPVSQSDCFMTERRSGGSFQKNDLGKTRLLGREGAKFLK